MLRQITLFKRDLNNTIYKEVIELSGSELQQTMQRQETENERVLTLEGGLFSLKR